MDQPWELFSKVDEVVEVRMLCRTSISEVLQFILKRTLIFSQQSVGSAQACENIFRPPNRGQLKRELSHLGQSANVKIQNLLWTGGAPLHIMNKNELMNSLLVKKMLSEDRENPPSSRPPAARQSRRKKRQYTSTILTSLQQ